MSGGSYNYLSHKVEDFAHSICAENPNPKREAFKQLCLVVAQAMHDIEWVDSCDKAKGDEDDAIDKVFSFLEEDPIKLQKAASYDKLVVMLQEHLKL